MHRRTFCKTTLAAAVAASLPGCSGEAPDTATDRGDVIPAVSSNGAELSIEAAAVAELAAALRGRLYLQGDEGYALAKTVWNGMFDQKRPAMVAQCESTADVVNAVDFARERNLLVSVKGGGHSLPGKSTSDGGMMIDLSRMHAVEVDADAQRMRADGGALLGHLDRAALAQTGARPAGALCSEWTHRYTRASASPGCPPSAAREATPAWLPGTHAVPA